MKYVIPILSLIISIIALAVALPRPNNLGIDYLGIIVAIISLATAFAVGFQIWNALSLETRLKELKGKIEEENIIEITTLQDKLTKEFNNKIRELSIFSSYKTSCVAGTIALDSNHFSEAFSLFISALEFETILSNEFNIHLGNTTTLAIDALINGDFTVKITSPDEQKRIIKVIVDSGKENLIEKIGIIKSKIFESET